MTARASKRWVRALRALLKTDSNLFWRSVIACKAASAPMGMSSDWRDRWLGVAAAIGERSVGEWNSAGDLSLFERGGVPT